MSTTADRPTWVITIISFMLQRSSCNGFLLPLSNGCGEIRLNSCLASFIAKVFRMSNESFFFHVPWDLGRQIKKNLFMTLVVMTFRNYSRRPRWNVKRFEENIPKWLRWTKKWKILQCDVTRLCLCHSAGLIIFILVISEKKNQKFESLDLVVLSSNHSIRHRILFINIYRTHIYN